MAYRPGRQGSFVFVLSVYAVAIGVAWAVVQNLPAHPLLAMAAGLLASTAVTYLGIQVADNGSVFDAWWSVMPPVAALYFLGLHPEPEFSARQLAVLTVVFAWALRLTANWARGWPGLAHEDWRYAQLAERWPLPRFAVRLLGVQGFPSLIVIAGCLPLYAALAKGTAPFGPLEGLALTVGLGAVALQIVADEQLHAFNRSKSPDGLLDWGLWRYSRHPNYLGEILFWVSLWLFACGAASGFWWTGIGALAMVAMFAFASVPMLDERSAARRKGYDEYARRTPALIPRPWARPPRSS